MATYNYPNDRRNAAGAIPVYIVAQPAANPSPPNMQNNAAGAIPVNIVAANTTSAAQGAIPVRVVSAPTGPPYASDQNQNTGAIPVWQSTGPKAMLVWRVN